MPSTAISAQGTTLKVGATAAAKTITAATKANPVKLTSSAHGLTDGTVVKITAVAGMTELNNKVGVVRVVDANSFELPGIDSTNFTTYTSGGSATPTQVTVGNLRTYSVQGAPKSQIDTTNLSSTSKEFLGGLQDQGTLEVGFDPDDADEGQMALWSNRAGSGLRSTFEIGLRNGKKRTFSAEVFSMSESGAVDDAIRGSASLRISGDIAKS